jgi:hypothetical protein
MHGARHPEAPSAHGEAWQEHADDIQPLAPYVQKAELLIKALDGPVAQLAIAGLLLMSVGATC